MALGDITHAKVDGILLPSSFGSPLYTVPAKCVVLKSSIVMFNTDASVSYKAELQFVESGGSTGDAKKVVGNQARTAIVPGEQRRYVDNPMLAAGDFIMGKADTAGKISFRAGFTLKQVVA